MKILIAIALLIPFLAFAQSSPRMELGGISFSCVPGATTPAEPGRYMMGCDASGNLASVSPTGVVQGNPAPTPIAITNGPNASVAQVEQILLALPAITPLVGRPVQVHMYVGYAKLTSAGFTTYRLLRNGTEILKTAHRCGGGLGESCHYAASVLDTGVVAGVPAVYELRWITSSGFSRSDSATNTYERRQMWASP